MSDYIFNVFRNIHKRYDLMNHLFSLNIDKLWRDEAAKKAVSLTNSNARVIDVATGTGDLAISLYKHAKSSGKIIDIYAIDINPYMLSIAKSKIAKYKYNINIEIADAENTRYEDSYFDLLTSAFALRNFDHLDSFAEEAKRIVKDKGYVVLIDMAMPKNGLAKAFFEGYFDFIVKAGSLINKNSYLWLTESVRKFDVERFINILKSKGFDNISYKELLTRLTFMITARVNK
ncbi:MAG: demethylmenaquinone methyltransferase [Candidatus Micrarchaeota archaeon]|nr:MAG: demethylmenaquinone methyltransferase [Candidatus Micrarchaeota archaeon]